MPRPVITHVHLTNGKIFRGMHERTTTTKSTGIIRGTDIIPDFNGNDDDGNAKLAARGYWVIIHAKSGQICWTGRVKSVQTDASVPHWYFEVDNTLNNSPDDPGSGDETVGVTVVNPDNGP